VPRTDEEEEWHARWVHAVGAVRESRLDVEEREGSGDGEEGEGDEEGDERDGDEDAGDAQDFEEASRGAAATLRQRYAAPPPTVPAKRGRKKKEEEIGPSGLSYTPLEQQFRALKAQWPDVLLLMEGESS
jgi:DNA mismatch repair protein MSH3